MISEVNFTRATRSGEWVRRVLINEVPYAVRLFDSPPAMADARSYWNGAVSITDPLATPEAAAQAAISIIADWQSQNPFSNLGFFVGVLITPDGRYRGGYQKMWSST